MPRGELVALKGRSGSGKTTLLDLVGGLDVPDAGRVEVDGRDLAELDEDGLLALRRDRVGFVFPSFGHDAAPLDLADRVLELRDGEMAGP